ncbi:transmembrane protein, putative (macronuclear) [Tetrahymena thermophila SB210]|uniref:Transmembrane protein, putative n=1 Tax=Tetrahymena thermophila (strain SB210) TaxID=312017 RepID=I7M8M4_TETTS|nr:transmembrane protein, putative [Tetrahymena thermophila SB210]EAR98454.2 transmembrane protein, putative [Tetrahymena thermophila SB210]|eukprot:XP_001018699.2 transmembrane protein, putative [Tetrahymena thermophila SB210]
MVNIPCLKKLKQDEKKELLSDNIEMLKYKKGELNLITQKFKNEGLELEYQNFFTPSYQNGLRLLLAFLFIQQLLTKINIDNAFDDQKRVAFFVFCGVFLLIVKVSKFSYLQKINWGTCIFTMLVLADCFLESKEKSELRILFNGMGIVISFWIQGHNSLFDTLFIILCFFLLHIFKGIDAETGLLSLFTGFAIIFLKYQSYIYNRETFLSLQLANYWQELAKEVSFVQLIVFSYDIKEKKFTFKGSKQSSEQFYNVSDDESLNFLLDNLVIDNMIKGPAHQFKEFVRNSGRAIKPILVKCFDKSMWPFHIDQVKSYVGVVKFQNYIYKFNVRGINSDDKIFTLSLSLADPESLREANEKVEMQQHLLQVYLWNNRNRYLEMQKQIQNASDQTQIHHIMDRTNQSLNFQAKVVKYYVQEEIKEGNIQQQNPNFNDSKNKVEEQNVQINIQNSQISNQKDKLVTSQKEEVKQSKDLNQMQGSNEKQVIIDNNIQVQQIKKNIQQSLLANLPEEEEVSSEITQFNLKQEVFEVLSLYNEEIDIAFNLDDEYMLNTGHQEFRQFLIYLFENCYNLQKLENIKTVLKFTQNIYGDEEKTGEFVIQMIVDEESVYYYKERNNENYKNGQTWYQALCKPFRYLNGNNHKLINSIEFQYLTGYLQSMHNKQMEMEQSQNCQILCTFWLFSDPAKSFKEIEDAQNQRGTSKNEFEIDENNGDNPFIGSADDDDLKHESFVKSYSVKPSDFKNTKQVLKNSGVDQIYTNKHSPSYSNVISPQIGGIIIQGLNQVRTTENYEMHQFQLNQDNSTKKNSQNQNDDQDCSFDLELGNIGEYGIQGVTSSIKQIKNYEDKFKTLQKQV